MSDKNKNKIIRSLRDFFSGKKTEEGEQIFNQWYNSFDDTKGYLDQLTDEEQDEYKARIFQSVKKRISKESRPISYPQPVRRKGAVWYKAAAVLVVGILLSFAGMYMSGLLVTEDVPTAMIEKSNPAGQISEFILPDGSVVWLSAKSTLSYPEDFTGNERKVVLEGEAYFDVKHDTERPFRVKSGPILTNVLGTSFNVRAYEDDPGIAITLVTGKVEVELENDDHKTVLEPNQEVRYDRETGLGEVKQTNASLANAWTQRELVFMRESFASITRTFERWYDVEFVFESKELMNEEFVYHFKELSLQNSMNILSELADFDYRIEDRKVYISDPEK